MGKILYFSKLGATIIKKSRIKLKIHKNENEPHRVSLLVFLVLSLIVFFILSFQPRSGIAIADDIEEKVVEPAPQSEPQQEQSASPTKENRETIKRGETISDILDRYNLSPAEIHKLREDVKSVYDLAKVRAGNELKIFTSQDNEVVCIEYSLNKENFLCLEKNGGSYTAEIKKIPYVIHTEMIWGVIEDNPINAISEENEGGQLAILLEEIFAWDIDFYADIREGDSFKIIFEKKYLDGEFVSYGKILAAEFTNQGESYRAFRYTYPNSDKSDYFDFEGNSLRKEFLKSPISGARITSRFTHSRLHPVRKVWRPHYGVDYAAPVGTPVRATADGSVNYVGRDGVNGRMVRIRHKNGYETFYLHLRRYGKGIKRGVEVASGQIIGYVGASGEVSGPHLDYRIKHRGKYINPLAYRFRPVEPLRKEFLESFQSEAEQYLISFDAPQIIVTSVSSSVSP
jgi:murein DD-endopeptidase MepM/ murein hydrolase activator NlpD